MDPMTDEQWEQITGHMTVSRAANASVCEQARQLIRSMPHDAFVDFIGLTRRLIEDPNFDIPRKLNPTVGLLMQIALFRIVEVKGESATEGGGDDE